MYQLTQSKTIQNLLKLFPIGLPWRTTAVSIQDALNKAYLAFREKYPEWVDSLFDESFLQHEGATLFADGRWPTAFELATAWRNQFGVGTPEQKAADIEKMVPAAATFLWMMKRELN